MLPLSYILVERLDNFGSFEALQFVLLHIKALGYPIAALLEELKRINYQSSLLIEYQGENDPRIALAYNVEYLKRQMQYQ